jgi:hypothetical protein
MFDLQNDDYSASGKFYEYAKALAILRENLYAQGYQHELTQKVNNVIDKLLDEVMK